jgi:uncharacterized lipoprotein
VIRGVILAALTLPALSGCFWWGEDEEPLVDCVSEEEYQEAQVATDLVIPSGLDNPPETSRLNIPSQPQPQEPLANQAGCLAQPPSYFDKPQPSAPAASQ